MCFGGEVCESAAGFSILKKKVALSIIIYSVVNTLVQIQTTISIAHILESVQQLKCVHNTPPPTRTSYNFLSLPEQRVKGHRAHRRSRGCCPACRGPVLNQELETNRTQTHTTKQSVCVCVWLNPTVVPYACSNVHIWSIYVCMCVCVFTVVWKVFTPALISYFFD